MVKLSHYRTARSNGRPITIALPEHRDCKTVGYRIMTGFLRGLHFKPNVGKNIRFINDRQIQQAIDLAKQLQQGDHHGQEIARTTQAGRSVPGASLQQTTRLEIK